jgi:hypothetical protein
MTNKKLPISKQGRKLYLFAKGWIVIDAIALALNFAKNKLRPKH